jgi:imidazolonepropionase-like amidohydrolase
MNINRILICALIATVDFLGMYNPVYSQRKDPSGVTADKRHTLFVITKATIHLSASETLTNACMWVRDGKIEKISNAIDVPNGSVLLEMPGKHIYPGFIEPSSSYGLPEIEKKTMKSQVERPDFGAHHWNMAVRPEYRAAEHFRVVASEAERFRKMGFSVCATLQKDGIFRGTAAAVSLAPMPEGQAMLKQDCFQSLSFSKGSSVQEYPSSLAGTIALIRQTFYDLRSYEYGVSQKGINNSFEALLRTKHFPFFFEISNAQDAIRAAELAKEFNLNVLLDGSGEEYQVAQFLNPSQTTITVPLNFPEAFVIQSAADADEIPLSALMHWEYAAANAAYLAKKGFSLALTAKGLTDESSFLTALRRLAAAGLPAPSLLDALTRIPAKMLGIDARCGILKPGYDASFIVCSDTLLHPETKILENWSLGNRYVSEKTLVPDISGIYTGSCGIDSIALKLKSKNTGIEAELRWNGEKTSVTCSHQSQHISLKFQDSKGQPIVLEGAILTYANDTLIEGSAFAPGKSAGAWNVRRSEPLSKDSTATETFTDLHSDSLLILFPFSGFGRKKIPQADEVLIKNATVWTCEKEGVLNETCVWIQNGKIAGIGKEADLSKRMSSSCKIINAQGKHLSPGIIDEHSHIALTRGVNEGTQNNTAEVRMSDALDATDIDIYRQLAGGVTAAQLLHGSSNPIGGQSALIKFRWGKPFPEIRIKDAPGHIKFALGENVKQSNWGEIRNPRFPQSRMGVEQVFYDSFLRAKEYKAQKADAAKKNKGKNLGVPVDLELEALQEILEGKRFITCHSYVQSEINMLMHVADSMGFKINTFTHILEGYKVADKLKKHGANASSFSDWWAYKWEVNDAIPYNGALLHRMGVNTGFNSDDAEMGRRLNQEAAKAVLYGGISESEALNFVTINPAKMLHIDGFTGSVKTGKDADLVLWSSHPLSVYAKAEYTFVDGVCYFDKEEDAQLQAQNKAIRDRITAKMLRENKNGKASKTHKAGKKHYYTCDDLFNGTEDNDHE